MMMNAQRFHKHGSASGLPAIRFLFRSVSVVGDMGEPSGHWLRRAVREAARRAGQKPFHSGPAPVGCTPTGGAERSSGAEPDLSFSPQTQRP